MSQKTDIKNTENMSLHNQIQTNIWRPYLESVELESRGKHELSQRTINNNEAFVEKATLGSYYGSEKDHNAVDFNWTDNVNRGTKFYFSDNCLQSIGEHMLHEQYRTMEKPFSKTYSEPERRNVNFRQNRKNYQTVEKAEDDYDWNNTASMATGVNKRVSDLRAAVSRQRKQNQKSMDRDILKTYYESEMGVDSCMLNMQEENPNTYISHLIVNATNTLNSTNGIVNIDLQSKNDSQRFLEDIHRVTNSGIHTQNIQKQSGENIQKQSGDKSYTYKLFRCKYCNYTSKATNLRRHIKTIHEDPFHRPHNCSKCDATFKTTDSLKSHMKTHARIPTFKYTCSECKTGFNNAAKYRLHVKVDVSKHVVQCDICNMTFKYEGCYELHQKDHVGVEVCMNRRDNPSLASARPVNEDIMVALNDVIIQEDEVKADDTINSIDSSNLAKSLVNKKGGIHSNEKQETFFVNKPCESKGSTVHRGVMKIHSETKLKAGKVGNSVDDRASMDKSRNDNISTGIKNRKPNIASDKSELKTACEEQRVDTYIGLAEEIEVNSDTDNSKGCLPSFREGEYLCVDENLESDIEHNKRALTREDTISKQCKDTRMESDYDLHIDAGESQREDCRKSNTGRDNYTKQNEVEDGIGKEMVIGVSNNINTVHKSPTLGDGARPNEDRGSRKINTRRKGKTKTHLKDKISSPKKIFKCDICEKTLSTKVSLNRHQVIHTGQKDFHCDVCGKSFALKDTLILHLRRHNGEKPYKCGQCGKTFTSISGLACHRHTHSNHRPYKCEICSRTFKRKQTFNDHNKYAHVTDKSFKCGICEARFAWRGAYRYHLKIHTGDNEQLKLQCHICNKFYSGKASLYRHIKSIHEKRHTKPYHCGECDKGFWKKSLLKAHIEQHDRKPTLQYSCAHCNSAFKTSKYLRLHMNMHKTGICYKCDICNIAFKLHKCYIMHQKKHAA